MVDDFFKGIREQLPPGCFAPETSWNGSAFIRGLVSLIRPGVAIEIGSHRGTTSAYIAAALKEHNYGRLVCYEMDENLARECSARLSDIWRDGNYCVVVGDFFEKFSYESIGFCFLDIDPKSDYERAWLKINQCMGSGSMLVCHDATYNAQDQCDALRKQLNDAGWWTMLFPQERGFLVAYKP